MPRQDVRRVLPRLEMTVGTALIRMLSVARQNNELTG
jgi:hypothetical protein